MRSRSDALIIGIFLVTILLSACTDSSNTSDALTEPSETTERFVYRPNSPHSSVLLDCTTFLSFDDTCLLSTLPFIGDGVNTPSVDDIMDRVIVQEQWMGERFETILNEAPEDARWLLSSVTHVELNGTSAGNFYRTWAGGINMSAHSLWQTDDERATLNFSDDPDTRFATHLKFRHAWSNNHLGDAYDEFNRRASIRLWQGKRDADQLYLAFMDGLYHELAHAATYVNPALLTDVDNNLRVADVTYPVLGDDVRESLRALYPLNTNQLRPLANSYYVGNELSTELEQLSADDVVAQFQIDGAMELYSYFSDSEDVATLFQATMMKYHFGAAKTIGFADKPNGAVTCESIGLKWGVHDRLLNLYVAQRAEHVANMLLDGFNIDIATYFSEQIGSEQTIAPGTQWCDVRDGI